MEQCPVQNLKSTEKEEKDHFIVETAKLAKLIAEQKDEVFIQDDCCKVVIPGSETNDLRCAATTMGRFLDKASKPYDKKLRKVYNSGISYDRFKTACNDLLCSTADQITQILLTFASYVHLSRAQNVGQETSEYVGRYFSDVGLQSWIQRRGGWQHFGDILSKTEDYPHETPA